MTETVKEVEKKALEIDAQIYHFHDAELIPLGLRLKRAGKVVIYDIHEDLPRALLSKKWINPIVRLPLSKLMEIYENNSSKKFDYLIAATPFIAARFKSNNFNTIAVNNYPLLDELDNSKLNWENKKIKVSYVGGFSNIRGAQQLIEASNLIKGKLIIAGPVQGSEIEKKIIEQENIEYMGILDREQVKLLLSESVAGIVTFLPEPNHINSQPNKMFEYMSAGIPVICSNFPLWESIIQKHECGICVEPKNPQAIADAVNYLINNRDVAEQMGRNGREAVEKEYNWEQESFKLISVYSELIQREWEKK